MPCYHPLQAFRLECGVISFVERGNVLQTLSLPCGQCIGCRLERSRQWAVRIVHEASLHKSNSFITLTYNDESLPHDSSLNYKHFQDFMKRLRKAVGVRIRFYMAGEYGTKLGRPHFHACIFGYDFPDKLPFFKSKAGQMVYRSQELERVWPFGHSSVGELTFESAAYVARYVTKKVTGDLAEEHYKIVDPDTGEIFNRVPEFNRMSLKPGIGQGWYNKYKSDVYPRDMVLSRGHPCKPPRYYDKLLGRDDLMALDDVKSDRAFKATERREDSSPRRLAEREQVALRRFSQFSRSLE